MKRQECKLNAINSREKKSQATLQRCSYENVFWKYAANLQRTPMPKSDFNKFAIQLSGHLFLRTPLKDCFWKVFPIFFLYKNELYGLAKNTVTNCLHPGNRKKQTNINNKKWKIEES